MHQLETLLIFPHENQWEDTLFQGSSELFSASVKRWALGSRLLRRMSLGYRSWCHTISSVGRHLVLAQITSMPRGWVTVWQYVCGCVRFRIGIHGIEVRYSSFLRRFTLKLSPLKRLLWCYFKHIILVASKRQTFRFKSLLHVFLFRIKVKLTHPKCLVVDKTGIERTSCNPWLLLVIIDSQWDGEAQLAWTVVNYHQFLAPFDPNVRGCCIDDIRELKHATFWEADANRKLSVFPFDLSSHNHTYFAKYLFSIRDDYFNNLGDITVVFGMQNVLFRLPSASQKRVVHKLSMEKPRQQVCGKFWLSLCSRCIQCKLEIGAFL